jgi:hypothetical protein
MQQTRMLFAPRVTKFTWWSALAQACYGMSSGESLAIGHARDGGVARLRTTTTAMT